MISICLASSSPGSGKTSLAAALGTHLIRKGKAVGYFRPTIGTGSHNCPDGVVMGTLLGLDAHPEMLCPQYADLQALRERVTADLTGSQTGKDVILIELPSGSLRHSAEAASVLGAGLLLIETYPVTGGGVSEQYGGLGASLLGVFVNKVPTTRMVQTREILARLPFGLSAVIAESRRLVGPTVSEMAALLDARVLSEGGDFSSTVENIMLGALVPDHSAEYYQRKSNKAVIVRVDRPDMQLSALETPVSCLVLAGDGPVHPMVLRRAQSRRVPVFGVAGGVAGAIARIEEALSKPAPLTPERLVMAAEWFAEQLDLENVIVRLGIAG